MSLHFYIEPCTLPRPIGRSGSGNSATHMGSSYTVVVVFECNLSLPLSPSPSLLLPPSLSPPSPFPPPLSFSSVFISRHFILTLFTYYADVCFVCCWLLFDDTTLLSLLLLFSLLGGTDSPGTESPDIASPELISERAKLYEGLRQLIATYWVLVVMGSFLLVILLGDPSLFKVVYLIFFFLFLIIYQVSVVW